MARHRVKVLAYADSIIIIEHNQRNVTAALSAIEKKKKNHESRHLNKDTTSQWVMSNSRQIAFKCEELRFPGYIRKGHCFRAQRITLFVLE